MASSIILPEFSPLPIAVEVHRENCLATLSGGSRWARDYKREPELFFFAEVERQDAEALASFKTQAHSGVRYVAVLRTSTPRDLAVQRMEQVAEALMTGIEEWAQSESSTLSPALDPEYGRPCDLSALILGSASDMLDSLSESGDDQSPIGMGWVGSNGLP